MSITDSIINYRRSLKRGNYSKRTVRNYLSTLRQFILWLDVPIEAVTHKKLLGFIDHLLDRRLKPKTINCYLHSLRRFYDYLIQEEEVVIENPVKGTDALRMSRPLPRYLRDEQVAALFAHIDDPRDLAIFKLMLRCGLRIEEVANLTLVAVDLRRRQLFVYHGKGGKDRIVYLSNDAYNALVNYLRVRAFSRNKKLFLVDKGRHRGKPLKVRGIQYRMQHYAKKAGLKASCHQLRHTMATQMLNADADLVTIQDLLGHARIKTTEQYCRVSNQKVRRDYYSAMEKVLERHRRTEKKTLDNGSRMRNS
jgi:site-specific recombinase XerD